MRRRSWLLGLGILTGALVASGCAAIAIAQSGVPMGGSLDHPVDVQLVLVKDKCVVRNNQVVPDPVKPYGPRKDKVRWEISNSCKAKVSVKIQFGQLNNETASDHPFEIDCKREKDVKDNDTENIKCKLRDGTSKKYKYRIIVNQDVVLDPEVEVWN